MENKELIEKCILDNNEIAGLVGAIEGSHLCTLAERIGFDIWQAKLLGKAIPIIQKAERERIHGVLMLAFGNVKSELGKSIIRQALKGG